MRHCKMLIFTALTGIIILQTTRLSLPYQEDLTCVRIPEAKRPSLLFLDYSPKESRLCIVYMSEGEIRKESILSVNLSKKDIAITQLDNAVFLLKIKENCEGKTYVMDLESGTIRNIADSRDILCLRSEPTRKRAMLVDFNLLKEEVQFLELDLASLNIVNRQMLPKALLGRSYFSATPGRTFKISPDFKHIAFVAFNSSRYQLSVLDIGTHRAKILDSDIRVTIPVISSEAFGSPPFEWISNNQLLYQHMPGEESLRDGLHVLKIVDIETATSSECFRKTLPMAFDGGSFAVNPLNGRLIYNRKYLLDTDKKTLTDKDFPYVVTSDWENKKTEIRSAFELLYSGNTRCPETWLSGSGKYFAYMLTPYGNPQPETGSYAVFKPDSKPLKFGEGIYSNQIFGWIE